MSDIIHLSESKSENDSLKQTRVVHWKKEPCDVYIGRPSKWGNPFELGMDGTRSEVIKKYKAYVLKNSELLDSLHELDGKVIGCWCKPQACHGDVLVELINERKLFDF